MCEIIAIIIVLLLIIIYIGGKDGFRNVLRSSAVGPYVYYNYDLPAHDPGYNSVFVKDQPLNFNVVLFTEANFGGYPVPIRKGKDALFAEQVSSDFKEWHFKSMKMKPGSKIQMKATLPKGSHERLLGSVNFSNRGYGSVPNINTLIRSHNDISESSFGQTFNQTEQGVNYYIREVS